MKVQTQMQQNQAFESFTLLHFTDYYPNKAPPHLHLISATLASLSHPHVSVKVL